ncbi:MAG TPA: hypothetical protein ENI80_09440 [Acidiferrobacteraceae bacterium]|nr:hypothetical protein [Acidiferrobacteraceae bacterium]
MSALVFKLRNVPDDEADDIRKILSENGVDYYETSAGNWGTSMPGIWIHDDQQVDQAKRLIDQYQRDRPAQIQAQYRQQERDGHNKSFLDGVKERPLRIISYLAVILAVLYLSTKPFIDLAK